MSLPWFRMYAEFATDPKVQSMSETLQRRYTMLLCLHCSGEYEELTDEELSTALRITAQELQETREIFRAKKFLDEENKIRNWNKRQYKSDDSAERVRKHREAHRVTVVKRPCNGDVTPSDTDTDTDIRVGRPTAFDLFWETYPKKRKRKAAEQIWKRKRLDAKAEALSADVRRRIASDQRWIDGFVPDPTTYLNGERWTDELNEATTAGHGLPTLNR